MVSFNADGEEEDEAADDVEVSEWVPPLPRPWSWTELAATGVGTVCGLLQVLANGAGGVAAQLRQHDDYRRDGVAFAEKVMTDIKQL